VVLILKQKTGLSGTNFKTENEVIITQKEKDLSIISNEKLKSYTIYNLTGINIKSGVENTINIETLASGIYILELRFESGTVIKKFAVN